MGQKVIGSDLVTLPSIYESIMPDMWHKKTSVPSRFLSGKSIPGIQQFCPSCESDITITIKSKQRIRCDCGLVMQAMGVKLYIWRD